MRKIIKRFTTAIFVLFLVWVVLSLVDITNDNCYENPTHSKYNLFILLTQDTEKKDAILYDRSTGGVATFMTEDGNLWEIAVDEPPMEGAYTLTFDGDKVVDFKQK